MDTDEFLTMISDINTSAFIWGVVFSEQYVLRTPFKWTEMSIFFDIEY